MEPSSSPGGRWLAFPRVLWLSLAAAMVLSLPMFLAGFVTDDYVEDIQRERPAQQSRPTALFQR